MALQHLRSSTAHKRPVPGNMSDGQLALNTNNTSPGLFFKDSNGALVKIGPAHVGTTAPNATPGSGGSSGNAIGEQWLDTAGANPVLKIWDGSTWQSQSGEYVNASGDVMTGALGIIAGSASAPGLYFSGDTDTGIYSSTAEHLVVTTGGIARVVVNPSAVIVGTDNANVFDSIAGVRALVVQKSDSSTTVNGSVSSITIGNGDTTASNSSQINFAAITGSNPNLFSSAIISVIHGTRANGQYPTGTLLVSTSSATNSAPTEKLRVTNNGYLRLSSNSLGIQFNGDTAAANALNDYEEGTFTPTIVGTSSAGTGTYTNQIGRYTKIGNRVTFTIYLNWTAHTGTGNIRVSNLPFTSTSATGSFHAVSIYADGIPFTGPWLQAYVGVNSTNIGMGQMTAAGVVSGIPMDSAGDITITGHYEV